MNMSRRQLLSLLKMTINESVPPLELFSSINSKELFALALEQRVHCFIYPTLYKYREEIKLEDSVLNSWKDTVIIMVARQIQLQNAVGTIYNLLNANNISTISLKGLVLKQLYSQPELRIMSDIDLLLDEKDIPKAVKLLITHGYYPSSEDINNPNYMHIEMTKPNSFSIELHRTLWHQSIMNEKDVRIWLTHIWRNQRQASFGEFNFTALSLEDELINLIIHLARHVMTSGSHLSQLCDITLFLKTHWAELDYNYIDHTIKHMDLFDFYQYLLSSLHLYFGLDVPIINESLSYKTEVLIDIIFSSNANNQKRTPSLISKKIKAVLKYIPFINQLVRILNHFTLRARLLRSIGLHSL